MDFGSDLELPTADRARETLVSKKLEKQGDFVSAKGVQSNGMRLRTKLKEFSAAVKWLVALDRHELVVA